MRKLSLLILAAALTQVACSLGGPTRPASFYALSPQPGTPVPGAASRAVAVGPIDLPELYDRPQIVTRPDDNRLDLSEYERWGGSLGEDLQRVLIQNLISRLNTDTVFAAPWQREDAPAFQVSVRFFRFDGEPDSQAHLSGIWQLLDARHGCRLAIRRFDIRQDTGGVGYDRFVAALSLGLARLSQDIAGVVATARPGCPAAVTGSAGSSPE